MSPVAFHERFMRLDVEFIVATCTVNLLVQSLGLCLLHVGADEAHVQPLFGHLDLGDHSAGLLPAPCLILKGMVTAVSGSMLLDLLNNVLDGAKQHVITAEAGHAVAVLLSGKEGVDFRHTVMAVAAVDDDCFRPPAPDMADNALHV